jgi:2,5-diamino-6-(ribosylamino)-4(3H)-pyrimidinone 5'-phosphate reductase
MKRRAAMKRPHVICHMLPSVDGRIVTANWDLPRVAYAEYERTAGTLDGDAWIIGRISMEPYAGKARVPRKKNATPIPRTDFIAEHDTESYAIAIDPSGKLTWRSNEIDGEHVITVLTEGVSDDYLAFLRAKNVSYLFGGKKEIDLRRTLEKLAKDFGIRRLLLEGGGKINGSFLDADLIDELSILVGPIADGRVATPTLFDATNGKRRARNLKLLSVERLKGDLVWLRYKVKR